MEYIGRIDELGGALKAIEYGYQKNEIEKNAYEFQKNVENKKTIIVGVNEFTNDTQEGYELFKVDEIVREKQIEKLKRLKQKRNNEEVESILALIKEKAVTDENLFPYLLSAVESYATIGEISNALREVWGEQTF